MHMCVCVWSKVCRIQYLTWPSRLVFIVLGVPQNDWQCTDILFPICAQRSYCRPCEFQFSVSQFASVQLFILFACLFIFLFSHLLPLRRMTISHFKKLICFVVVAAARFVAHKLYMCVFVSIYSYPSFIVGLYVSYILFIYFLLFFRLKLWDLTKYYCRLMSNKVVNRYSKKVEFLLWRFH